LIKLNLRFNRKEREELVKVLKNSSSDTTSIELLKQISDLDKKKELLTRKLNEAN
jgi:hypothetical protein